LRVIAARAAASAGLRPVERFVAFRAFTGTAWVTLTVRLARALPSVMVSSNVNVVRVRTSGSTAWVDGRKGESMAATGATCPRHDGTLAASAAVVQRCVHL
jgi:hypothetical protein